MAVEKTCAYCEAKVEIPDDLATEIGDGAFFCSDACYKAAKEAAASVTESAGSAEAAKAVDTALGK